MSSPPPVRDWTALPPEMLLLLSSMLLLLSDFIRFRSVCPSWRASAPASAAPPQLPWLLFPHHNPDSSDLLFYSQSTEKIHNVAVSEADGRYYMDLLTTISLLLIQNQEITLFLIQLRGARSLSQFFLPRSVCRNGVPIYNRECMGCFARFGPSAILAARQLDEIDWKKFRFGNCQSQGHTFYKGKYYLFDRKTLNLATIDLITGLLQDVVVLPPESSDSLSEEETMVDDWDDWGEGPDEDDHYEGFNYLIESFGDLLRVNRSFGKFNVYHVDLDCQNPRWVKQNSIGDAMFFLDSATGIAVRASDFPGFSGNCIYYIKYTCNLYYDDDFTLCRDKLEDGTTEVLTRSIKDYGTWFVPSLV
ncbi:hypothetical protein LUZ60_016709 [Juncus effusus]|nr:hypothetical protein LUZ60_016709 [Juncus effusus]